MANPVQGTFGAPKTDIFATKTATVLHGSERKDFAVLHGAW